MAAKKPKPIRRTYRKNLLVLSVAAVGFITTAAGFNQLRDFIIVHIIGGSAMPKQGPDCFARGEQGCINDYYKGENIANAIVLTFFGIALVAAIILVLRWAKRRGKYTFIAVIAALVLLTAGGGVLKYRADRSVPEIYGCDVDSQFIKLQEEC